MLKEGVYTLEYGATGHQNAHEIRKMNDPNLTIVRHFGLVVAFPAKGMDTYFRLHINILNLM